MTRSFKALVIALSGTGFLATGISEAEACHGRHRGGGGHHARVVVVQRPPQYAYAPRACHPPVQHVQPIQQPFAQGGVVQGQSGAVGVQFQGQQVAGQQFAGQQVAGQQVSSQQFAGQQVQGQQVNASGTAIDALGGQQQIQSQQIQSQPQVQQQPMQQAQVQQAPVQQAQAQTQAQPQAQAQSEADMNAQDMALQALSGLDTSDTAGTATQASAQWLPAAAAAPQPGLTGTFAASVRNGQQVRLDLHADGTFIWTATGNGKSSNFQGKFSLNNGSLTLHRSDNYKLEATLRQSTSGFDLKLPAPNNMDLSFVRV